MSAAKPTGTNSAIEQHYFEQFRAACPLLDGTPCYADKPDVIMCGIRKIGVEITRFFLQSGSLFESEQRQRPMRREVVSSAQELYRSGGGKEIELTFAFNANHPITSQRRKELPGLLANLAKCCDNQPSGLLDGSLLEAMREVESVYVNTQEYPAPEWRVNGVYTVEDVSAANLEAIIREKEAKLVEYRRCDTYWLLIVVDGMDAAQEQEIRADGLKISSQVFEKIFIYKPGFDHVVRVSP
jgi:hypothetical protein